MKSKKHFDTPGLRLQGNYYYIVKDTNWLNVGVGIQPINRAPVSQWAHPYIFL